MPPDTNALGGTALMMSTFVTSGGGVGVAYCNVSFRSVGLLEFHDTTEWNDLESVAIQVSVGACELFGACLVKWREYGASSDNVLCGCNLWGPRRNAYSPELPSGNCTLISVKAISIIAIYVSCVCWG